MTSIEDRERVTKAWREYHTIVRKCRNGGFTVETHEPPADWDWSEYIYEDAGPGPIALLFEEYAQAEEDGEACIFRRADIAEMIRYLSDARS